MSGDLREAAQVRARAGEWLKTMQAAGIAPATIGTGVLLATIEMLLVSEGVERTAVWLHNMARNVDELGCEWLQALTLGKGGEFG